MVVTVVADVAVETDDMDVAEADADVDADEVVNRMPRLASIPMIEKNRYPLLNRGANQSNFQITNGLNTIPVSHIPMRAPYTVRTLTTFSSKPLPIRS